jgi:arabinose-5-phosphate isomerase
MVDKSLDQTVVNDAQADIEKLHATWLDEARQVLKLESDVLLKAAERLDDTFIKAVSAIQSIEGKVVVTGLGKSGHVGRKIAATLASTGTPAFFIHPAEALHGDLGMIGDCDCILAIAFGGETQETNDVVAFARRRKLPVISITGKPGSTLAKLSDFVLDGRVDREACPHGLAPTSSTTLAMALGDALAATLMKANSFEAIDFAAVHPAGSLGRKLSRVIDHLRSDIPVLAPSDDFHRILEVVTAHNYGIAAVIGDDGTLLGAITDGDLRRALIRSESKVFQSTASELMTAGPKTITKDALAIEAFQFMEQHQISALFVMDVDKKKLSGLVRMFDLLEAKVV